MSEYCLKKARKSLNEGKLNRAVEILKDRIRRDSYWAQGHLLLGDIYLIKLKHYVYALVEYRKLKKIKQQLTPQEKIRLAYAYYKRDFPEKVSEILDVLKTETLPEKIEIIDKQFSTSELIKKMRGFFREEINNNQDKYYERNMRKGREYMQVGDFFRAQKSFEKALELNEEPSLRIELARCQIQRVNFSEAIKNLKKASSDSRFAAEAQDLLRDVYHRLGLPVNYEQPSAAKREEKKKTG
jgi:lipopolysaccharide biosynthesis regulator YciM